MIFLRELLGETLHPILKRQFVFQTAQVAQAFPQIAQRLTRK